MGIAYYLGVNIKICFSFIWNVNKFALIVMVFLFSWAAVFDLGIGFQVCSLLCHKYLISKWEFFKM